jgi:biopolymer transport protein ExbD
VLLVIFMATLPMTQRGVDVNLPLETSATSKPEDNTQVLVEYTAARELTINKKPVALDGLESAFRDIFDRRTDKTVFLVGDAALRYGEMVSVIDAAHAVELRVAIVTPAMQNEAQGKK